MRRSSGSLRPSRPLRTLLAVAAAVTGTAAAACTDVGTDPSVPVAIELRPPPLPSVLVGDSMRDSTGQVVGLQALVFNVNDEIIQDAPVRFLALDTLHRIRLDTTTGVIVGTDTGQAPVVANAGALQSLPDTIVVVDTPTVLQPQSGTPLVDTLNYTFNPRDTLKALGVELLHVAGTDTVPVRRFLVRYAFEYPAGLGNTDSTQVMLVDEQRRGSLVDTTDGSGRAGRSLRITPFTHPFSDSVVVRATAVLPNGTPVPGSPVRFVIHVTIQ